MDYRRAQRNLQLVNENNIDNDLKVVAELQENERNQEDEALISTQVPSLKFSQSSASSPEDNKRIYSSSRISSPIKTMGLISDPSNIIKEVDDEDKEKQTATIIGNVEDGIIINNHNEGNILPNDSEGHIPSHGDIEAGNSDISPGNQAHSGNTMQDDHVLISTQIQSRLDVINRDSEIKGKLSQFRYAISDSAGSFPELNGIARHSKRLASEVFIANESKQKKTKTCSQKKDVAPSNLTRAQDLLKKLSGKHRKVRDILKGQQEADKKNSRGKVQLQPSRSFDVYNAEEWKTISSQILKNFPRSNTQDVKDVFFYLYGDCDTLDMWGSSQKPPEEFMPQSQQNKSNFVHQNKKNDSASSADMMKLLTLSQVMEDTTDHEKSLLIVDENIVENVSTSDEQSLYITQENVVDEQDVENGIDLRGSNSGSVDSIADRKLKEDEVESVIRPPNRNVGTIETKPHNIAERDTDVIPKIVESAEGNSNSDEDIILYDSMDEMKVEFPNVEQLELDQYKFIPTTATLPPLIETFNKPDKTYKEDDVDLTQASFTVSNELISPIKSEGVIPKESTPRKASPRTKFSSKIQVPATRAPTLICSEKSVKVSQDGFVVNARLSETTCERISNGELPFKFTRNSNLNKTEAASDDTIIYDSDICNHKSDCERNQESNIFELKYSTKEEPKLATSEPPIALVSESKTVETNVIMSQSSAQDLRRQMKEIGLRPVRSKTEMIESLENASQVLGEAVIEGNFGTRQALYDHLTKLVKNEPSLLERIQTFQPILMETFLYELNELDPLVNLIDESTIQSWADANGVSLKRS
ncbi:similar to Saccharomyces cerevisiae YLR135W SLX4 Endonuclease involved in processing DNA during recombination and repair [Maudiozyma saulgeensis]|uniref:Structure-specific endonuclease subunit SLX4 n=1 Tax=Maudiozyma saulgeensis TaxID=1789683 RepID=A0A1X7R4S2_9SACH|nr:similar to Saccharomyces cerevisiae YLR135W SLX4 Endonuclease involved in processing DNA during recombination and repair [Kazachstania saulgeensis]